MGKASFDLSDLVVWLAEWREAHRAGGLGSGRFARTSGGKLDGYACADFTVIDYTLGPWPLAPSEIEARALLLQEYQSAETGLFEFAGEGGPEDAYHATAYVVSALELLGVRPMRPLRAFDEFRPPDGARRLLEGLDWTRPWAEASKGAGVSFCLAVTGDVGPEWFESYFSWLAAEADPETGLWRKGVEAPPIEKLGGTYQYCALFSRFRRPLPHPQRTVQGVLGLQRDDGLFDSAGPGWLDLGAAFVLSRASRQAGYAAGEVRAGLLRLLDAVTGRLMDEKFRSQRCDDTNRVAAALSVLAELSTALPGSVRHVRPLRLFWEKVFFV